MTPDPLVPADPVREHVRDLMAAGVNLIRIAERAGVSWSAVFQLMYSNGGRKPTIRMRQFTAEAILGVTAAAADPYYVDSVGSTRRLRALIAIGWTRKAIAADSGLEVHLVELLVKGTQPTVAKPTRKRVAAIYDRLSMTPPPHSRGASRSRTAAARNGWASPLAWDDDEIDNPAANPRVGRGRGAQVIVDEVAVERLKRGQAVPVNKVEQRTAIAELAAAGVRSKEIADRLGMGLSSAIRTRNRITAAERQTA